METKHAVLAIIVALVLGLLIGAAVFLPLRAAFIDLREENETLKEQVQHFKLCSLQAVECTFEKDAELEN